MGNGQVIERFLGTKPHTTEGNRMSPLLVPPTDQKPRSKFMLNGDGATVARFTSAAIAVVIIIAVAVMVTAFLG